MSPIRYIATAFVVIAALCALTGIFAWSEFGHYTRVGYASCAYIGKKIELAQAVPAPKLVVVGGSNVESGIEVGTLAKALPIRAFNFALVATFSPGFQLFEARKVLKPGDAALLTFEYLAYEYQAPTNGLVNAVYSCGVDYWRSLDWPGRLFFVFAIRPQHYFSTLAFDHAAMASVREAVERTIKANGDEINAPSEPSPDAGAHQPLLIGFREYSNGVREITKFLRWAKANNVTVFATWPNTLYFKEYNAHPAFAEIVNFYRAAGVEIIGRPQDAMVSSAYLADTIYHLTAAGIAERTRKLVENLKSDRAFVEWLENARPAAK